MVHIPPLFDKNQQLDKSEPVNSLATKAPRIHKAMLNSQGFNPETGDLATSVEHCERAETSKTWLWPIFLPQTRALTPRETKRVPKRSRNARTTVKNVVIQNPRFVDISMVIFNSHLYGV